MEVGGDWDAVEDGGEGLGCPVWRFRVKPGMTTKVLPDQPIGDVDVVFDVFRRGVLLEDGADGDVEMPGREIPGQAGNDVIGKLLGPELEAVDVGEGDDLPPLQDQEFVAELGFTAGGQPEELGKDAGTDDGRLLGFDQGNRLVGMGGKQVLAEEALRERPGCGQFAGILETGMHPVDAMRRCGIFDAVAGLGVVLHDLAGAATTLEVELEEDDIAIGGDAETVVDDQHFDDQGVEECAEEGGEGGVTVGTDGAGDVVAGNDAEFLRLCLRNNHRRHFLLHRMFGEVVAGGLVVAAGGFAVAAADGGMQGPPVGIDVARETVLCAAGRAGVARGRAVVFLEVICRRVHDENSERNERREQNERLSGKE